MAKTSSPSLWVQLYFVLSSLLGLSLAAFGSMMLINVILGNTVLKVKDRPSYGPPPAPYILERAEKLEESDQITEEQKQSLVEWRQNYQQWHETERNYDYQKAETKRQLTSALALLLTGIPILLVHAPWVFRQTR